MKPLFTILAILLAFGINAQNEENEQVKATIIKFFDAFHKQDSVALRTMAKGNITLQSIYTNKKDGKTVLREDTYDDFIKSIVSIPKDKTFEEKLLDFQISVDGKMANAWTPYEFWFDGNFSHCGVNSFQLIKEEDTWKIIYLVDTRRRGDCDALKNPKG